MTTKERLAEIVESLSEEEATAALERIEELRQDQGDTGRAKRVRRVRAARGFLAGLPGSVEGFLREKHEETNREEAAYHLRQGARESAG